MSQRRERDAENTSEHRADTRNPDWESYVPNGHGRTDEQIRADVHERLCGTTEEHRCAIEFTVFGGVVTVRGEVPTEAERRRILAMLRDVPSVADVHDEQRVTSSERVIQPN